MADKFEGWIGLDKESGVGGMKWQEYEPKKFEETDVDMKITHCGICGTDVHSLRSGLFPSDYPICPGHEIVGEIIKVGSKATGGLKVGQIVGVGPQIGSCSDCENCASGKENYCPQLLQTYGQRYPDGTKTYGGFAKYWRGPSEWVFKIPSGMPAVEAAPMFCAGITVYSPLKRFRAGPGKTVGIVGFGGLGHFGVLFAKALGADKIVAISRTNAKKADALKLGATDFIATEEDKDWAAKHANSLDIILNTVSTFTFPMTEFLGLFRTHGTFVQLGVPALPDFPFFILSMKGLNISGSIIGSPAEINEMLDFAVKKGIHPIIQEEKMADANKAILKQDKGDVRYRLVLTN